MGIMVLTSIRALPSLCVSASLRETLIALALGWLAVCGQVVRAEESALTMVNQKTQARFEEIAEGVQGVMGIVVEDLAGEHRFAVNEDREFAQASAIKIPILMEVLKQADEGKIKLDDRHWVTKKHQVAGSGILSELGDHTTQMSVEDLAVCMIVLSDNSATNILIELVGMDNVTATMKSLGCEHTRLQRRMLDTEAAARGQDNLSTPADAARLMRLLAEGKFVSRKVCDHALEILRKPKPGAINSVLPSGVKVAFKPGEVPGVMTEWALVELKDRPYIVTVMGSFQLRDEFKDAMKQVSQTAYDFFQRAGATKYGAYIDPEEWAKH